MLALLLALTLGIKYLEQRNPGVPDDERLEQDIARAVAPQGYQLSRSEARIQRFDAVLPGVADKCRANIAVARYDSAAVYFFREVHRREYSRQAEFYGGKRAARVPWSYVLRHYLARQVAPLGIDWPVTPYVLMAWNEGCPMPARNFAALKLHYRRSHA